MDILHVLEQYLGEKSGVHRDGNVISVAVSTEKIVRLCDQLYHEHHLPLKTITAVDDRAATGHFRLLYVFGIPEEHCFLVLSISVTAEFPSLTPSIHEASNYERKIKTLFGLEPVGHPDPRRVTLHEDWPVDVFPLRKDVDWKYRPQMAKGEFVFRSVAGEGVYEIPVGPVHAGIIEPGHFRFSVLGEEILSLEPRLGYSHKGSEKLFEVLPRDQAVRLSERISGDSAVQHALAICQALEVLCDCAVHEKAQWLRVIFSELERIANHLGDIGAIMIDTGYNFGGAQGARLRELVMRMNEQLTGNRFLRGVIICGGVTADLNAQEAQRLSNQLEALVHDFSEVMAIADHSSSLSNRLNDTGTLDPTIATDHGVIGVAGRALGFTMDARKDYPYASYAQIDFKSAVQKTGDVNARLRVRIEEVYSSVAIIQAALKKMPTSGTIEATEMKPLKKNAIAVGITEGWRGDVVYVVVTNADGAITRVNVRDPSFLNWAALGYAGVGNMVPDFPLINKSFNLSYSGNDV